MTQPAAAGGELPATVDVLAGAVIAIYVQAEQDLLAKLASIAERGLRDSTAQAQVTMLLEMQAATRRIATALRLKSGPLAQRIIAAAASDGDTAAIRLIQRAAAGDRALAATYLPRVAGASRHGIASANAIAVDLAGRLAGVTDRIVRYADDAYRAAVSEAATRLVLGREGLTPRTAQNLAWNELTRAGITGFTDTRGRNWNLSTYVEMATRTATQRAYNTAHQDRMTSVGINYFTISHDGHPCPLCKPWEGAILSTGHVGSVVEPSSRTGQPVHFVVAGTLDQARAAGLQHPNCRHVLLPYFPGVTKASGARQWTAADQRRYDATQRLRALERNVRALKRQQASALDEVTRQRFGRDVRAAQARIRAHISDSGLVRRPNREQLDLGNR